jgi:hypothetical protein
VYETEVDSGKGPRLFSAVGQLVAPDAIVFYGNKIFWAEVKHKTAFTWHQISGTFQTGIDIRHYEHYLEVAKKTNIPLWIFFLQAGGQAKNSPPSPPGLFGNEIRRLERCEHHRSDLYGSTGMVYWTIENLKLVATYDQVMSTVFQTI